MKSKNDELLKKLLDNISESEDLLKRYLKEIDGKFDEATELQEISNALEKTFKQLNDLKNDKFSEEE
jgi:hypothetical protein|tara:strand:- start:25 stop:225 length:201 start_codon:yes stop_codon:yes gene_type:complete